MKDKIEGKLRLEDGEFKKTVYIAGDVELKMMALYKERNAKSYTALLNDVLREYFSKTKDFESRLEALEKKVNESA